MLRQRRQCRDRTPWFCPHVGRGVQSPRVSPRRTEDQISRFARRQQPSIDPMRLRIGQPACVALKLRLIAGEIGDAARDEPDIGRHFGGQRPPKAVCFDHDRQFIRVAGLLAYPAPVPA